MMNKITQTLVGADLSRTPPIYRPSLAFLISRFFGKLTYQPYSTST
jgi:hypothetical protein